VVNFMTFVAQEVREYMAQLGFRTFEEMVGHSERLEMHRAIDHWKAHSLDFSRILFQPQVPKTTLRTCQIGQEHKIEESLDSTTLIPLCEPALERGERVEADLPIRNVNRVVGTTLGSEVTRRYGAAGLPEDTVKLHFRGSAGQSFGAFIPNGITLTLEGDANDYLGKGLSGGKIVLFPPRESQFVAEENVITGNVAFYGATSGEAYIRGIAGERFCVRNSGLDAVVEGLGDHGCEYMTGGHVVVIGKTGRNFAAGMSGGIAYVLDESGEGGAVGGGFERVCNKEMVGLFPLSDPDEAAMVRRLLERHAEYTASTRARALLDDWATTVSRFVRVVPNDYRRVVEAQVRMRERGLSPEEAEMAAFEENVLDARRVAGN
jgi:glutamate synthase (ferredoxin)